ncbi:MAG TPA: hypothetical protein VHC22_23730 [Pirellulales bacterium]|nr:hypothetical protein [Pirellulales bacterium]
MKRLLLMIGLCPALTGCTVSDNFMLAFLVEPTQYCDYFDAHKSHNRHCRLAKQTWSKIQNKKSMKRFSDDYAQGFRDGFTDFLDAGGTGQPPPLPPRCYWKNRYANPQGRRAVQDWFAGFRHGAAMARASGAREYALVPMSTPVASVKGIYVNRQTGPTPVTILTPPVPDPALVAPRAPDGGFDTSQLPDATRPFGLLPGALPTRNLPPTTLPPGTSPPGVQPVWPGAMLSEPASPVANPPEAIPPGAIMPIPVPPPDSMRSDDLLPKPSSERSPPNASGRTGPALLREEDSASGAAAQPPQPTTQSGATRSSPASLVFVNEQPDSTSGATARRASAPRGPLPPYSSSRRWAAADRR